MPLPDYAGGSIVNLMRSIAAAFEDQPSRTAAYPPLRELSPSALAGGSVVLIVLDGLGFNHLSGDCGAGSLRRRLKGKMTSVFPSATATAITTFMTGLAPQQHALTGWHMYFRELGASAAVLPFRMRCGGTRLTQCGVSPAELMPCVSLFDRLAAPAHVVSPERIVDSEFTVAHSGRAARSAYRTAPEMFERVAALVRGADRRSYVYAYYPELDALGHEFGIASAEVKRELAALDDAFERFMSDIRGSDAAVVVTADHGFIDTCAQHTIDLASHPELADTLLLPLCGEARVAYCYVRDGERQRFESYVRSHLSHAAMLHESAELIEQGWFGVGAAHPQLRARVGDYTLLMRDDFVITDRVAGEKRHALIGVHGGISDDEMYVPLIVARA